MTEKKLKLIVYANCQGRPIAKLFRFFFSNTFDIFVLPENYKLISGKKTLSENDIGNIQNADVLITHFMDSSNVGFRAEDLIRKYNEKEKCITIKFPYIFLSAYWPDYKQVNPSRPAIGNNEIELPYGTLLIDKYLHKNNFNKFESFSLFIKKYFSENPEIITNNVENSFQVLKNKEKHCDAFISDYLLENYKSVRLFHSACHPVKEVYFEMFKRIVLFLNKKTKLNLNSNFNEFPKDFYDNNDHQLHIYPEVIEELKITFHINKKLPWFKNEYDFQQFYNIYTTNLLKHKAGGIIKEKSTYSTKYLINMGAARSGTTAMHAFFEKHSNISVPKRFKEIKAFMQEAPNVEKYRSMFNIKNNGNIFFESSPPYMHNGIEFFHTVLDRIQATLGKNVTIVFNIRSLLERAFSHYWHDINKHHSIYGKLWSVRSIDDKKRYKALYRTSFSEALRSEPNKFCPDIVSMIQYTGEKLGWDNIVVIPQSNLEFGVKKLCEKMKEVKEFNIPRISSTRSPIFLCEGSYLNKNTGKTFIVEPGTLLRMGYDSSEILSEKNYNITDIFQSYQTWTKSYSFSELQKTPMFEYIKHQVKSANNIPISCFYSEKSHSLGEVLNLANDVKVKEQAVIEKL